MRDEYACDECGWVNGHGTGCPKLAPRGSAVDDAKREADLDFLARLRSADVVALQRMKRLLPASAPEWKHVALARAFRAWARIDAPVEKVVARGNHSGV